MRNTVLLGDVVERLRDLATDSIDAIVTDPPYGLEFMGKEWDGWSSPAAFGEWCRQWAVEALRVLKPGGHLLAFGGTRMYHRLATGIEDAGFEIRDTIAWLYGSGFPKSHNLTGEWSGFGTALKPAHEPVVVARKPLIGTVAQNVQTHGTGALNIDGCRVEGEPWKAHEATGLARDKFFSEGPTAVIEKHPHEYGRWPANVAHDGSVEVLELFPEGSFNRAGVFGRQRADQAADTPAAFSVRKAGDGVFGYGDSGSAARFFYCAKASRADREAGLTGLPERPAPKNGHGLGDQASLARRVAERGHDNVMRANDHPTVKPHDLMRWLVRLVGGQPGSLILDPFAGSGSTLRAARAEGFDFLGIERDRHYYRLACLRAGLPDPGEADEEMC